MNETTGEFVPAMVFHPSQVIAEECIARGWTVWDLVERVGTLNAPVDVLAWEFYAACGPTDPMCRMSDTFAIDMERVFGVRAEVWERIEALCKKYPDRLQPLDSAALAWYGLDDDEDADSAALARGSGPHEE